MFSSLYVPYVNPLCTKDISRICNSLPTLASRCYITASIIFWIERIALRERIGEVGGGVVIRYLSKINVL